MGKGKKYCCVADMALSISHYFPELLLRDLWKKRRKKKFTQLKERKGR